MPRVANDDGEKKPRKKRMSIAAEPDINSVPAPMRPQVRGWLLERKRLVHVISEAKTAQMRVKLLDQLIASYGGTPSDDVTSAEIGDDGEIKLEFEEGEGLYCREVDCKKPDHDWVTKGALGMHLRRAHNIEHGAANL